MIVAIRPRAVLRLGLPSANGGQPSLLADIASDTAVEGVVFELPAQHRHDVVEHAYGVIAEVVSAFGDLVKVVSKGCMHLGGSSPPQHVTRG